MIAEINSNLVLNFFYNNLIDFIALHDNVYTEKTWDLALISICTDPLKMRVKKRAAETDALMATETNPARVRYSE